MTGLAWSPQPAPSRPEGAVRHAHPLAIQQAGVGAAVSEKLRTIRARLLGPPGTPRAA